MRLHLFRFPAALALLLTVLVAGHLSAQDADPFEALETGQDEPVDRIAAVVGDSIILYSQVLQRMAQLESQGAQLPTDPEGRRDVERQILEGELVPQLLLLQAADQDSMVVVEDQEVSQFFEGQWQQQVQQFGGEAALEEAVVATGQSLAGYRGQMRENLQREILLSRYIERMRTQGRPVVVDEAEVREYFEQERSQLEQRPATIRFRQAFVEPRPSEEAMEEAVAEIERIMGLLAEGESFQDLARRFSHDEGSRQQGGEIGWVRRGASDLDRDFEDAAFGLREGQTAGPVETTFGAHLIRVDRVRSGERMIRHILISAQGDDEAARDRALEIRDQVAEGSASIRDFPSQIGETLQEEFQVAVDSLYQFPSAYETALRDAQPGDVLAPLELPVDDERRVYAVVEVMERREAGDFTFEDFEGEIREVIRNQRFQQRLLGRLENQMYIEIRL